MFVRPVTFLVGFGAIVGGAATSIKVQQSSDNGSVDTFDDLAGTSITIADTDDNKIAAVEIAKPQKRYLRVRILRATQNSTVDFVLARTPPVSSRSCMIQQRS